MAALDPEALWACRTCLACEEVCPAGIGHVAQILELRRAEVLHHGRLPADAAESLWNLARTGNPYGTGPEEHLIALGYAGWSPGQLEQELAQNSWLTLPADSDIIFSNWAKVLAVLTVSVRSMRLRPMTKPPLRS